MSSSLSELRNFRLNKAINNANGASPSNKLATGRKRIRAISDSSDDEHTKKQPNIEPTTPVQSQSQPHEQQQLSQPIENGAEASEKKLGTKEKEERFHLLRAAVDKKVDSLTLQDFLVQNDWDVQKAYDAIEHSPKFRSIIENSPTKPTANAFIISTPSKSPIANKSPIGNKSPELIRTQKKHKVSSPWHMVLFHLFISNADTSNVFTYSIAEETACKPWR